VTVIPDTWVTPPDRTPLHHRRSGNGYVDSLASSSTRHLVFQSLASRYRPRRSTAIDRSIGPAGEPGDTRFAECDDRCSCRQNRHCRDAMSHSCNPPVRRRHRQRRRRARITGTMPFDLVSGLLPTLASYHRQRRNHGRGACRRLR